MADGSLATPQQFINSCRMKLQIQLLGVYEEQMGNKSQVELAVLKWQMW
jgi:hypothetical protein